MEDLHKVLTGMVAAMAAGIILWVGSLDSEDLTPHGIELAYYQGAKLNFQGKKPLAIQEAIRGLKFLQASIDERPPLKWSMINVLVETFVAEEDKLTAAYLVASMHTKAKKIARKRGHPHTAEDPTIKWMVIDAALRGLNAGAKDAKPWPAKPVPSMLDGR